MLLTPLKRNEERKWKVREREEREEEFLSRREVLVFLINFSWTTSQAIILSPDILILLSLFFLIIIFLFLITFLFLISFSLSSMNFLLLSYEGNLSLSQNMKQVKSHDLNDEVAILWTRSSIRSSSLSSSSFFFSCFLGRDYYYTPIKKSWREIKEERKEEKERERESGRDRGKEDRGRKNPFDKVIKNFV